MKYVIYCSTQRSGSTMICDKLSNAGVGHAKEHYLNVVRKLRNGEEFDLDKSLAKIEDKGSSNNYCSFKIMISYLHYIDKLYDFNDVGSSNDLSYPHFTEKFKDAIWFWVIRRNTVKQAISRLVARKSKIFHSYQLEQNELDSSSYNDFDFDLKKIKNEISKISTENALWQHFFDVNNIQPTVINYESVVANPNYLDDLCKDMGIATIAKTKTELRKLSNSNSEKIYNNYIKIYEEKLINVGL